MTRSVWNSLTSATAAAYIGLVFVQAAWHKLSNFDSFTGFVIDYQIVPEWAVAEVSRGIIAAEMLVTLALVVPGKHCYGACLAITMLLVYTAAMTTNIVRGRTRLECGCGGAPQLLSWTLVVRNVALAGVAALVLLSDASGLSASELVVSIAGGFTLWIGFVLTEQILANASRARLSPEDPVS